MLKKRFINIFIVVFSLLLFIAFLFLPLFPYLSVASLRKPFKSIFIKLDGKNREFVISYTHSVNKGKVKDYYIIKDDNSLSLVKTRFVSYGAGIAEPDGKEIFVVSDDYIEIQNINRDMKMLIMFVGVVSGHAFEVNGKNIYLDSFFTPRTNLYIEYKNISFILYMLNYFNIIR